MGKFRKFADIRNRPHRRATSDSLNVKESFEGSATADLLMNLMTGDPTQRKKYQQIRTVFTRFFPQYSFEIRRDPQGIAYVVLNRSPYEYDIPPEQTGTGVFEILTIIANLEGRERDILVLEEPGTHLHPQAQRALQRLIVESSKRNQIFVLTHSPEFVNWASLKGLSRVFMKGSEAHIARLPDDLDLKDQDRLVEALRHPFRREMLFACAVALVEGDTERTYLEALAPRMNSDLDARGVSVIPVEGEDDFKQHLRYLEALQIPVRCLRDKVPSGLPDKWKTLFTAAGDEFEVFMRKNGHGHLLDEAVKEVGKSKARVGRYVGEKIDPSEVPALHQEFIKKIGMLLEG
jgi:hypothetical protein